MIPKPNYPCVSARSLTRSQLLGWRQDDVNASGFKVPLLFGGSSKEGIGGKSCPRAILLNPQHSDGCQRKRESDESFWTSPEQLSQLSSFLPHPRSSSKPSAAVAFHRNKNPQTHPEASLLVPTESGRRGFESLLEHDSKTQLPLCVR